MNIKMTQYNSLNVKLSNSQLNKFKSAIKNENEVVLSSFSFFPSLMSQGRGVYRARKGKGKRVLRAGYGRPLSSASQNDNKMDF